MLETVVLAVDGSESGRRAVTVGLDLAARFDASVYALSVVEQGDLEGAPERLATDLESALEDQAHEAVVEVAAVAPDRVETAVRTGRPTTTICSYVREVDADLVVLGTRGRHGENRLLLGSVAESVVRTSPVPVLTARQLE